MITHSRSRKKSSLMQRENRIWKLMIAPSMIVLVLMSIYPMIFNIYNSLFDWNFANPNKPKKFVGLNNFITTLTDQNFLRALLEYHHSDGGCRFAAVHPRVCNRPSL